MEQIELKTAARSTPWGRTKLNNMVTVLFTQKNSIYNNLRADTWDIKRNATSYQGQEPIIAHPPCRAWGRLYKKAKPKPGEKELAIWAINHIRKYGGVLEHPAGSKLWKECNIPTDGSTDQFGGFTISINQSWFGHRAEKRTWLYIVGIKQKQLPPMPIKFDTIVKKLDHMGSREREATPRFLAIWLISVIERIKKEQKRTKQSHKNALTLNPIATRI